MVLPLILFLKCTKTNVKIAGLGINDSVNIETLDYSIEIRINEVDSSL